MSNEQRTFSRIQTRLKGYARRTASVDTAPLYKSSALNLLTSQQDKLQSSKVPEGLADFLIELDNKLDMILSLLSQDQIRTDFPISIEVMEISGAGIKFRTKEKMALDQCLEVVIVLNQSPLRLAGSKGVIKGHEEDTNFWRFEFTNIREQDIENVVQYVFQEQREQIRLKKWS